MKKTLFLLALLYSVATLQAQDIITRQNGDDIKARILEITLDEIKYKRYDNLDGPTYIIPTDEVLIIHYENGTNEVFDRQQQAPVTNYSQESSSTAYASADHTDYGTAGMVHPGMRYSEYAKLYKPKMYVPQPGDRYNPGVAGVLSFLIPGLGQILCDEVGYGLLYFFCSTLGATSFYLSALGELPGLMFSSLALWAALDICVIVDAVQMAKIKNMYYQDMHNMASIDVHLAPYISTLNTATVHTPIVGASLAINF